MRPKIVIAILLLALAVLGIAVFLSRPRIRPAGGAPPNLPVAHTTTNPLPAAAPPVETVSAPAPAAVASANPVAAAPPAVQETNHEEYVQDRVAELMALAMNDDSNSFDTIWSELSNPDKDIRAGALEAVVQFGARSAAPRLRDLAALTQDPAEKAKIIDAADFLELPPLTDLHPAPTNGP
jgi:hypothetical protein